MDEIQYFKTVANVSTIIAVVMLLLAILMWFKLGMYHYIMVLSGSGARKGAEKIRRAAQEQGAQSGVIGGKAGGKAIVKWGTSESLWKKAENFFEGKNENYLLYSKDLRYLEQTMPLESAEEYATRVLEEIKDPEPEPDNKSDFIIEREIISKYYNGKL
ncbi:hypothetical protein D6853_10340 [Butyrivibrio sp. X503]|uniref:hypothetical protein n=1 Tax=Butyrivibrio sp. X503 TaxID=2364878 RepID=UPI000EAA5BAF|nr:hypothetical protein [Butyrivibrio sp. X503]RKM55128.1 hypothetical protein D6853_10340 [Butyrivibrio sp. X503]